MRAKLFYLPCVCIKLRECFFLARDDTGDPLHSRAACTQPCNVNTHSRAHCSPGARLCEQWGHGCVNNGARLCASARLCRGSPVDEWDVPLSMHCHDNQSMFSCRSKFNSLANIASHNKSLSGFHYRYQRLQTYRNFGKKKITGAYFTQHSWNVQSRDWSHIYFM